MKLSSFCKFVAMQIPIILVIGTLCGELGIAYKVCMAFGICTALFALGDILEILQKIQEKKQSNDHSGDTTEMVKKRVEQ